MSRVQPSLSEAWRGEQNLNFYKTHFKIYIKPNRSSDSETMALQNQNKNQIWEVNIKPYKKMKNSIKN